MGFYKLNVDASIKKGICSSFAGVLRNDKGEIAWCFSKWQEGVIDVDSAEALAVLHGLELARQHGIEEVEVEFDSQTVVFALNSSKNDLSYYGRIIEDIRRSSLAFERISFAWIRREANIVAHKLAFSAFARDPSFFSLHIPTPFGGDVMSEIS
ncbi:hypothetical protein ACS0TY_020473 [Phlomoides rotata]